MPFRETCPVEERIALFRDYETGVFAVSGCAGGTDQPGDILRLEAAAREWCRALVRGRQPCREELSACNGSARGRAHRRGQAQVPAVWPQEDQGRAGGRGAEDERGHCLAGTVDDWRYPEARGAGRAQAPTAARRGAWRARGGGARPNEEWAIDFKGWYRTASGLRCDPLTVTDGASRFLLATQIVPPTTDGVKTALWSLFEAAGLPDAIRSDNGTPFGSTGAGGLSACRCGG